MDQQFDFFSRSVNLFRNMSTAMLSSSEKMISLQLDSAQACVTRGSEQFRAVCSDLNGMKQPKLSSDAVQFGMRNAIAMTRDNVLATSGYQLEALSLLQRQGSELQKIITDLFNEHLAVAGNAGSLDERASKVENLSRSALRSPGETLR